jgi:hypothetical protein
VSTEGYSNITVLWGARRRGTNVCSFSYSIDGTNWIPVTYTEVPNQDLWSYVNDGVRIALPANASGVSNLQFRWQYAAANSDMSYRLDNFTVQGTCLTPVADFAASTTAINQGESVTFTDLSSNTPTSRLWTFVGGTPNSSNAANPTVVYNTPGVYSVTLRAVNSCGNNEITKTGYIEVKATSGSGINQRGSATTSSSTSTSLTVSKPAGVVPGDIMLLSILQFGTSTVPSSVYFSNTGWKLERSVTIGGGTARAAIFLSRIVDGTEGNSFTFSLSSGTTRAIGSIIAFSGVDPASPFDALGTMTVSSGAITNVSANSITTSTPESAIVMLAWASYLAQSPISISNWYTSSTGVLEHEALDYNYIVSTASLTIGAAWEIKGSAGSTGNGSAILSGIQNNVGLLLALKPIPATPTISDFTPGSTCYGSGSTIVITGTNLTGAISVSFNNVSANFTVNGPNQITAILPPTATTGPVRVITPSGSAVSSSDLIINSLPDVRIFGENPICAGDVTTLFPTSGGVWSSSNPGIAVVNNSGLVTSLAAGSVTFTFTTPDGCSATTNPVVIEGDSPSIISIQAVDPLCAGYPLVFSLESEGGSFYELFDYDAYINEEDPFASGSINPENKIITISNLILTEGSKSYVISVGNKCTSTAIDFYPEVSPTPSAPFVTSGQAEICLGSSYSLVATSTNNSIKWYTTETGEEPIGTTASGAGFSVSPTVTTTYYAESVSSNGCASLARTPVTVTVKTIPDQPGEISGPNTPCQGSTQTYSVPLVAGVTYTWSYSGTGVSITGQGSNSISAGFSRTATSGTWTVIPSNNCGAGPQRTRNITMDPLPGDAGDIAGNINQCANMPGQTYGLLSEVANPGSYQWTVPSGWAITNGQGTRTITVTTGPTGSAGNITVTPVNSCGEGISSTLVVSANRSAPAAAVAITGPAVVCPGSSGLLYSVAAVNDAETYTWEVPSGWTITSGQGNREITVSAGFTAQSGNIFVVTSNACGSNQGTLSINPINSTNNTGYVQNNGTKNSGNISVDGFGTTQYRGYIKFPLPSSLDGTVVTGATLNITNYSSNYGGETNYVRALTSDPVTTEGTTLYNNIGSGTSYNSSQWSSSGTLSLVLNAAAVNDIQNNLSSIGHIALGLVRGGGNVYNFYGYSGGTNAPTLNVSYRSASDLPVTVNARPNITSQPSTGTNRVYCLNDNATALSITATAGSGVITGYQWYRNTSPTNTGGSLIGGATSASYTPSTGAAGTLYYYCIVTNSNGCSTISNVSRGYTVNSPISDNTISSDQSICPGTSPETLTGSSPGGGSTPYTYTWQSSTNGINFANASGTNWQQNYTPGSLSQTTYYRRMVSGGGCTDFSNTIQITINPLPGAVSVSGGGVFCNEATLIATGGSGGTIYFQGTTSQGTSTATPVPSEGIVVTNSGTYYFRAMSSSGCWGPQGSATVTITQSPATTGATMLYGETEALLTASGSGGGSGPVTHYPFNQSGSTTTVLDVVGGRNGTLRNGASWTTLGRFGNAVNLNSNNSNYVELPTGIVSSLNSDYSISTWVYLNSLSTWSRVFDFGASVQYGNPVVYMFLTPRHSDNNGTLRFAITTSGNAGEQMITGSSALPTNSWVHVVVTLSGTTGTLYVNGLAQGTNTNMTLRPSSLGNTNQNRIGRSQWSNDPYLNGRVDEFRIYDRALSSSEVTALYNSNSDNVINWYTQGGVKIGEGSPFNPVGAAGSGVTSSSATGDYKFYAEFSSAPGCRTETILKIECPSIPPQITANGRPTSFCEGGSVDLYTPQINGYSYEWYKNGSKVGDGTTFNATETGNYTVKMIVQGGVCDPLESSDISVVVYDLPDPGIFRDGQELEEDNICKGQTVTYTTESGMTGYAWNISSGGQPTAGGRSWENFITVTWNGSGTVSVNYANANGCRADEATTISVNVHNNPTVSLAGATSVCAGVSATLSAEATAGSGSISSYQWYRDNAIIDTANGATYNALHAGTYKVVVTNSYGCSTTSSQHALIVNYPPNTSGATITYGGENPVLKAVTNCGFAQVNGTAAEYPGSGVSRGPGGPFDAQLRSSLSVTQNSTTISASSITTQTPGAAVIMFAMSSSNNTGRAISGWTTSSPGSLTEIYDYRESLANYELVGAAWARKSAAGSTGTGSATLSQNGYNGGYLLALKPATPLQINQRGSATTGMAANSNTLTINKPTGVQPGDILIVNICSYRSQGSVSVPTANGWTEIVTGNFYQTNDRGTLLYRIADGTEGPSFTFSFTNANSNVAGAIIAFSGVDVTGGLSLTGSGLTAWTLPNEITQDDYVGGPGSGGVAYTALGSSAYSESLIAGDFVFSPPIPAGATINGITVNVNRWGSGGSTTGGIRDITVQLLKSGMPVGANKADTYTNWPTSSTTVAEYGNDSDKWGIDWTQWSDSEINSALGVKLEVRNAHTSISRTAYVDYIQITVHYTSTEGGVNWYTTDIGGAPVYFGTSFDPALAGTNSLSKPGKYTYWAACADVPECRTPAELTINKAKQEITWANPADITYGTELSGTQLNATITGVTGGATPGALKYNYSPGHRFTAGTYKLRVDAPETDYYLAASAEVTLVVDKAPLTVTADNKSKVYGAADPELTYTVDGDMLRFGDQATVVSGVNLTTKTGKDATFGTHVITASGGTAANYVITCNPGTLTVSKASLTVTADNKSKVYGAADPVLTRKFTGELFYGDQYSVVTGVELSTATGAEATAGTHTIVAKDGVADNYSITHVNGTLTVDKASLTVTADNKSKVYGAADPALTYTPSGTLFYGASYNVITGVELSTVTGAAATYGTHVINITGGTAANYNVEHINGTLNVSKAPLTITAENKEKFYGDGDPEFTVIYSGFKYGEGESVVSDLEISRDGGETVGDYTITPCCATADNYNISFGAGTLTINQALVESTITVSPESQQYSDMVTLSIVVEGGAPKFIGGPQAASHVEFFIGGKTMGTVKLNPSGDYDLTASLDAYLRENWPGEAMAPGVKDVTVIFISPDANYKLDDPKAELTITREDAFIEYTGDMLKATASATTRTATVTLRAHIFDSYEALETDPIWDNNWGDIRNAQVKFVNLDTKADITGWIEVTDLVEGLSNTRVGTVSYPYTITIPTNEMSTTVKIGIMVGGNNGDGYYIADLVKELVTIYIPDGDFITGGGYIVPYRYVSNGTIVDKDPGHKLNFGFNVKFNKPGTSLKGHMNVMFRKTESDGKVHTYQIKSNAIISLGVNTYNPAEQIAEFVTKGTLTDVTDENKPIDLGGNKYLYVKMTDRGEPGRYDMISFALVDGTKDPTILANLIYSSNWVNYQTRPLTLRGGNLVVHSGFSLNTTAATQESLTDMQVAVQEAEFGVNAYPNPFTDHLYFDLRLKTDSKVRLELYTMTGTRVATLYDDMVVAFDRYRIEYTPDNISTGMLIYRLIIDGQQVYTGTLIKY